MGVTPEELVDWATVLGAATTVIARVESDVHRASGVTPFEYHLLGVLENYGGDVPMSMAAHLVDSSLSRLSHVVRRLETRGWVARRPSPDDARVSLVSVTEEGSRRLAEATAPYRAVMQEVFLDRLGEDQRRDLARGCRALLEALRPDHWLLRGVDEEWAPPISAVS